MSTTEDRSDELQVYELGYLILPSVPEDKLPQTVDSLKKIVTQADGREIDGEAPFTHPLAYPMTKVVGSSKYVVNDAYIGWLKFETDSSKIDEIKANVEKLDEILRYLIIKTSRETGFTFASVHKELDNKNQGNKSDESDDSSDDEDDNEDVDSPDAA